jgi:integrase
LKLPIRGKPFWLQIGDGLYLGYRRNQKNGSWSGRKSDGRGGNFIKVIGPADDFEGIPGALDFWQAQAKIRELFLGTNGFDHGKLVTVAEALAEYRDDLVARGGETANAARVEHHLSPTLAKKIVAGLSARDFKAFRKELLDKGLAPASVNRTCKAFAAACALAASHDPRIKNRDAWRVGLAALPDATTARNVILPDVVVSKVVAVAAQWSDAFQLLVEVLALTGARPIQAKRLTVADLQRDRLMMPSSKKGKGKRRIERRPVPIPANLAARLRAASKGRAPDEPLLLNAEGEPWDKSSHRYPMRRTAERSGLDPDQVTIYALRHSSITRQLLGGVPVSVVARHHDTSEAMIRKHYADLILDHSDELTRKTLLDLSSPPTSNVTALSR